MAGPGGIEVGRAAIRVLPDTSAFGRSLERYIQRVERTLRIEIPTVIDDSGLQRQADKAREKQERQPVQVPLKAQLDDFARRTQAEVRKLAASVEADIPLTADGELFRQKLDAEIQGIENLLKVKVPVEPEAAAAFRQQVRAQVEEVQALVEAAPIDVPVQPEPRGLLPRVAALVARVSAMAPRVKVGVDVDRQGSMARLLDTTASLVPTLGRVGKLAVGLGPPLVLAAAAVTAMAPAIAILAPLLAGTALAAGAVFLGFDKLKKTLTPLGKAIQKLKAPIGDVLTKGLEPLVSKLVKDFVPALSSGMKSLAGVVNQTLGALFRFLGSASGIKLVKDLFDGLGPAIAPLGAALTPFTAAILKIGVAATPALKAFSLGVERAALAFDRFISQAALSGQLQAVITKAVQLSGAALRAFGSILKSIVSFLIDFGPAGVAAFAGLASVIGTVLEAVKPLVAALLQNKVLLAGVAIAILALVSPTAAVIAAVIAGIQVFRAFAPQILAALAPVIAGAKAFGASLQASFQTIAPAVMGFVNALLPTLMKFGQQIIAVVGPALAEIGRIIQADVAPAFASFLSAVTPVANFLLNVLGGAVVGALKGMVTVVKGALKIIAGLFNAIAGVLTGNWSQAWEGIKQIAVGAFVAIKGLVQVFLNVGLLKAFRLGMTALGAIFRGGWALIRGLWSAGLNGIKSLAGAAIRGIGSLIRSGVSGYVSLWRSGLSAISKVVSSGLKAVVGFFARLPGQIRSALGNVGGLLADVGRWIVDGLIRGIQGAAGRVTSAARALVDKIPGAVRKFMGIQSPSKVMIQIGKYIGDGLIEGLLGSSEKVRDAATSLAEKLRDAVRAYADQKAKLGERIAADAKAVERARQNYTAVLRRTAASQSAAIADAKAALERAQARYATRGPKTPQATLDADRRAIADAQRRYQETVRRTSASSQRAIETAKNRLDDALARLAKDRKARAGLDAAFGVIGDQGRLKLLQMDLAQAMKQLEKLADAREAVAERLKDAEERLAEAVQLRDNYAQSVRDSALSFADITRVTLAEGEVLSPSKVVASLKEKLNAIRQFREQIDQLRSSGLSDAALKQLVDAGVEAGGATADALIQGGRDAVDSVNELTANIATEAELLGKTNADAFFQAGVDSAQGLVDGLLAKQEALESAAKQLADELVRQVKKALGIKSPSTVMAEVGRNIGAGLARGMEASQAVVARATDRLSATATPVGAEFAAAGGGLGGAGGNTYNFTAINPEPETQSESATRFMRRLAVLGPA